MNIKAALEELTKMASERIFRGTLTDGSTEANMRVKFRDLRRILMAMQSPAQEEKKNELIVTGINCTNCGGSIQINKPHVCPNHMSQGGSQQPLHTTSEIDKANGESLAEKFCDIPVYVSHFFNEELKRMSMRLAPNSREDLAIIAEYYFKDRIDQARKEGYEKGLMTAHSNSYDRGYKYAIAEIKERFDVGVKKIMPSPKFTEILRNELFGIEGK